MRMRVFLICAALSWATGGFAQDADPADAARQASAQIVAAADALAEAEGARDRVRALTRTVQAYEAGLAAMRDGLRRVATREAQLTRQLAARQEKLSDLLGVLQTISAAPPPILMLHPAGPLGSARSGMMMAEVTPALNARATELRRNLEEVQTLRFLQESATQTLADGLAGVQRARTELSQAVANRTDLPKRFTEDPVRTAILISSTETLDGFASGLSEIANGPIAALEPDEDLVPGALPLPVQGVVLRRSGEADAAGITRPGIVVATRPRALVSTPVTATIRYLGPLLDLGNVAILEPQPGIMIVLSGLADVFGEIGQVLPQGAPVGLMGGADPEIGTILSLSSDGTGTDRSETLYIEVRENNDAVDPDTWFRTDENG